MKVDCCALILNYNGEKIIENSIDSLINQTVELRIAVIDNNSSDGSVKLIKTKYPKVEIIQNSENLDFGKAYNRAIKMRDEKYIFIMNNDIVVEKNSVKNAIDFLEKNPDVGAVSFITFDVNEEIKYPYRRDYIVKKRFGIDLKTDVYFESPSTPQFYTTYIWGGACIIRREIFDMVQFDEDFEWSFEDADLGWMINNRTNFRTVVLANAVVHHIGGASTKRRFSSDDLSLMDHRNAMLSFMKNATIKQLLIALPHIFYFFIYQRNKVKLLKLLIKKFKYERVVKR